VVRNPDGTILANVTVNGVTTEARYTAAGQLDPSLNGDPLGNDSLVGGPGNDTLVSGAGITTLVAGSGSTTFYVNNSNDVIIGNSSSSINTIYTSVSFDLTKQATGFQGNLIYDGASSTRLVANNFYESLRGGMGSDTLIGYGYANTMQGFFGNGGILSAQAQQDVMGTPSSVTSNGANTFVLADSLGSFYLDTNPTSKEQNFAIITNFGGPSWSPDQVVLSQATQSKGSGYLVQSLGASAYASLAGKTLGSTGITANVNDLLIFDTSHGTNDLVADIKNSVGSFTSSQITNFLNNNTHFV
jgi:Ca2+-binding RTX toxin-like protein